MPPDRELRQMVVDLAALRENDVEAVLSQLDPAQRRAIETLLREFSAFGFGASAASVPALAIDEARVSSWIVGRTDPDRSGARMTPLARSTLRDAALRLYPATRAAGADRPSGSVFGRIKSLLWTGDTA